MALGTLVPYATFLRFQLWRLVTYMFLHDPGNYFHILFNMLVLWMFGAEMEELWGKKRFTIFYLVCGVGSGLFSLVNLFSPTMSFVRVLGASGAVLGILTAYAFYFPHRQVLLFFILPVNIRVVVIGYAVISVIGAFRSQSIISHLTHLGGIVVAFLYIKLYPIVSAKIEISLERWNERKIRGRAVEDAQRKRYFEQSIDPILDKIARQGMDSLTADEKKILRSASKNDKGRLKGARVIPFDLFRNEKKRKPR
jgi:membrane associated rhomboid family serine protease